MNPTKIRKAMAEAQEFIRRAKEIKFVKRDGEHAYEYIASGPVPSGALRRQSMELTRALAELRKSS